MASPRYTFRTGQLRVAARPGEAFYTCSVVYDSSSSELMVSFLSPSMVAYSVKLTETQLNDALRASADYDKLILEVADHLVPSREARSGPASVGGASSKVQLQSEDDTELKLKMVRGSKNIFDPDVLIARAVPSPGVSASKASAAASFSAEVVSCSAGEGLKSAYRLRDESRADLVGVLTDPSAWAIVQRLLGQEAATQRDLAASRADLERTSKQAHTLAQQVGAFKKAKETIRDRQLSTVHGVMALKKDALIEEKETIKRLRQEEAALQDNLAAEKRELQSYQVQVVAKKVEKQLGMAPRGQGAKTKSGAADKVGSKRGRQADDDDEDDEANTEEDESGDETGADGYDDDEDAGSEDDDDAEDRELREVNLRDIITRQVSQGAETVLGDDNENQEVVVKQVLGKGASDGSTTVASTGAGRPKRSTSSSGAAAAAAGAGAAASTSGHAAPAKPAPKAKAESKAAPARAPTTDEHGQYRDGYGGDSGKQQKHKQMPKAGSSRAVPSTFAANEDSFENEL